MSCLIQFVCSSACFSFHSTNQRNIARHGLTVKSGQRANVTNERIYALVECKTSPIVQLQMMCTQMIENRVYYILWTDLLNWTWTTNVDSEENIEGNWLDSDYVDGYFPWKKMWKIWRIQRNYGWCVAKNIFYWMIFSLNCFAVW